MTNLDSILKSRDITLSTKVLLVKAMVFPIVIYGCENWTLKNIINLRLITEELMLLNCGVGEDSWESLGLQGCPTSPSWRRSVLGVHWKNWCWSWNCNTLATWCEELIHLKRPWCWKRLRAGGEGDNRGWDGWKASRTQWTWVWIDSGSWWWTGRPGMLRFMGSQRVGHYCVTELNWTESVLCQFYYRTQGLQHTTLLTTQGSVIRENLLQNSTELKEGWGKSFAPPWQAKVFIMSCIALQSQK